MMLRDNIKNDLLNFRPPGEELISYYDKMLSTTEDSPYHQESSVLEHTQMVVENAMEIADEYELNNDEKQLVYLVALFHDIGKPDAEEKVYRDDGSYYKRYTNHGKLSARIFIDLLNRQNYIFYMKQLIPDLWNTDIILNYTIPLMIEYHMPYKLKDQKLENLIYSIETTGVSRKVFETVILADSVGRIADDDENKQVETLRTIDKIESFQYNFDKEVDDEKYLYILIGPSGAGKDTWISHMRNRYVHRNLESFSLDDIRVQMYKDHFDVNEETKEIYRAAFDYSNDNHKDFRERIDIAWNFYLSAGNDIVVNNTNLSKKDRKRWINTAKQKGYTVIGVIFNNVSFDEIKRRQNIRCEKEVPEDVLERQFYKMTMPILEDEMDSVQVVVH